MRLPEEVEPWRAGAEAGAAVRERVTLGRQIRTLRDRVVQTYQTVRQTEDAYVEAALNATASLANAERAFEHARELYRRTLQQFEQLRQRHAALTGPAQP